MGCAGRLRQIQRSFGPRNGLHYEGSADLERVPNQELTFFFGGGKAGVLFLTTVLPLFRRYLEDHMIFCW